MVSIENLSSLLCISIPGIGDAYLATPMIAALKERNPGLKVDLITRRGSEGAVVGHPLITEVITIKRRQSLSEEIALVRRIFRRYECAISTNYSDRAFFLACAAAPHRYAVLFDNTWRHRWKSLLCSGHLVRDEDRHVVIQNMRFAEMLGASCTPRLGITPLAAEELPRIDTLLSTVRGVSAVVHPFASSDYKVIGQQFWRRVIAALIDRQVHVVITGGPSEAEVRYCQDLAVDCPVQNLTNLCGKLSILETAEIIRRANFFVGNDTALSHISAGIGKRTFCVFGPTNFLKWAPWPQSFEALCSPYKDAPGVHTQMNVTVLRAGCGCLPFGRRCSQRQDGFSECLQSLDAEQMIGLLDAEIRSQSQNRSLNRLDGSN